ncbi:MAG TPA: 4-hydroxy-tetrahydrodipicolinate synthase [Bacillota bacterium]|nr:4-hydroxy-tetrahydrodipicolinate synthase [Bacillota bacterium]
MKIQGVWLPIITPFIADEIDYLSYAKMIDFYIDQGISGLIPLGTTGESPAIEDAEFEELVARTMELTRGRVPVFVGAGGNYTKKVVKLVHIVEKYKADGILSVSPYYNRPDQNGIYQHFLKISESTPLPIIIYNIPYRTGRNIENETIYKLAGLRNIVGLKDSCGDLKQSMDLLLHPPADLAILTGEDALYYTTMLLGGAGGILASAHLATGRFVEIYNLIQANNHQAALEKWRGLADFIPLLFMEPNPAPLKYCLQRHGLIKSLETRLPLTEISEGLKGKLDQVLEKLAK